MTFPGTKPHLGRRGRLLVLAATLMLASLAYGASVPLVPGLVLETIGAQTENPDEVLSGKRSIKGSSSGNSSFQVYLRTDAALFPLGPGRSCRITFRYKILAQPDRGFEVLFFSPKAGAVGNFLPSSIINGPTGTIGVADLTSALGNFDDYQLRWNIVGRGAITIDDIQLIDVATGLVLLAEDAEGTAPSFRLAQAALPPARIGRTFAVTLGALGGRPPHTWRPGTMALPPGLQLDADGHLSGKLTTAGNFLFDALVTDANQSTGRLTLRLSATVADPLTSPPPLAIANNLVTVRPQPYLPAFRNPLGGMRPGLNSAKSHPFASLGRQYIEWNLIENSAADTVEKIRAVTDGLVGDLPSYNIKIIPRVYLHWPDKGKYWPADLSADDYSSAAFRSRMTRLIARLGEAWDSDPRIAFIETGIIGYWGEQHTPSFLQLPAGMDAEFGDAYRNAFPNKKLMRRYPRDLTSYDFGIHWDVFGAIRGGSGNDTTLMTQDLESPLHLDAWKTSPRGGEIDPTFIGEPLFNTAGLQAVVRKQTSRLVDLARRLHWNHLAVLDQIDRADAELWDKASQIQNALGYRFVISEATHTAVVAPGGSLSVSLNVRNTGSSAFHYPWPLEVALADARTRKVVWRALWEGQDLRTWLPGEPIAITRAFPLPPGLPAGQYVVTLAILDPSGLVPAARFAVQSYWMGGRTPLGPVAIGAAAPESQLNEFDDLQSDNSLYYLPPSAFGSAPLIVLPPVAAAAAAGQPVSFSVAATGAAPLSYQWTKDGRPIPGATGATLTLAAFQTSDAGSYSVVVTNAAGSVTSPGAALAVASSRLINLSILTSIAAAGDTFTLGYVVGGAGTSGAKPLVIRAAGPSLAALGVTGTLDDPKLELFAGASKTGENDNWGGAATLASAMAGVGAFAYSGPNSNDAAAAVSVTTRDNSVKISAGRAGTGAVIAEIYDATPSATYTAATPRLVNVSVLKPIGDGLTAGFAIGGAGSKTVLIRAVGPGLAPFGVAGAVADPRLELFDGSAKSIGTNDNWGGTAPLRAAFAAVGAFGLGASSNDAALLITLPPGSFTVQVSGVGGTTGVALVEVYELP